MSTIITASRTAATIVFALIALLLLGSMAAAEARGRHGGNGHGYRGHHGNWSHGHHQGHRHRGHWRGGVSIGIGVGAAGYHYGAPWWYPGYGVVLPPSVVYTERPRVEYPPEPLAAKGPPDPIFYPRNGQSASQTEADLHDCNRWALTQPDAAAKADVFHRATLACMEGRNYTVR